MSQTGASLNCKGNILSPLSLFLITYHLGVSCCVRKLQPACFFCMSNYPLREQFTHCVEVKLRGVPQVEEQKWEISISEGQLGHCDKLFL